MSQRLVKLKEKSLISVSWCTSDHDNHKLKMMSQGRECHSCLLFPQSTQALFNTFSSTVSPIIGGIERQS